MTTWAHASSKLGAINPATRSKAKEIFEAAQKAGHDIWFMWGMGGGSEHGSGNALDLMVRNEAAGDWIRNYIWANRERLRLRHVIWEQHITSTVSYPGVRRKMEDRGNTTQNHKDHNHVWFLDDRAYVPPTKLGGGMTAPYTPAPKPPATKPTVKVRTLGLGLKGDDVKRLQRELKRLFPLYAGKLAVDGSFGPKTLAAVRQFQARSRLERDGRVGPKTRAKLKSYGARL